MKHESFLDKIGIETNTDKASIDRRRISPGGGASESPIVDEGKTRRVGHDYLRKYEFFLAEYTRKGGVRFLELGAGPDWNIGASVQLWTKYFWRSDFKLDVADIKPSASVLRSERVTVHIGDLGDDRFLETLQSTMYDIILDDASHLTSHQLKAFSCLWKAVAPGGLYIIEDLHTSFGPLRARYHSEGARKCSFTVLARLAAEITGTGQAHPILQGSTQEYTSQNSLTLEGVKWEEIDMITFINHACIIKKAEDPLREIKIV